MPPIRTSAALGALLTCALSALASPARAEPATLFVTVGDDAADGLAAAVPGARLHAATNGSARVAEIPAAGLSAATRFMHDAFRRCGGFVAHPSLASATAALEAPIFRSAARSETSSFVLDNPATAAALIDVVKPSDIEETVRLLSTQFANRYFRTPAGVRSALALQKLWREAALGREDVSVDLFYHPEWPQPSVVLTMTGRSAASEVVVLGAHLDSTVGQASSPTTVAPGADDDASGIAVLTAVANAALDVGYRPERTIKIIGYAAEEVGLRGSRAIAASFAESGVDVVGVLQLDMVLLDDAQFAISLIDDFTDPDLNAFLGELIDTYLGVPWTFTSCGYACSDHASWTELGFPASYPFESSNGFNQQIHTSGDTLAAAGLSISHAAHFARLGAAFLAEMGSGDLGGGSAGGTLPPSREEIVVSAHSVATGAESRHGPLALKAGSNLLVATSSLEGDVDLYLRFDGLPDREVYDCRSAGETSNETCFVRVPDGAKAVEILAYGFEAAAYELEIQYTAPGADPDPDPEPEPEPEPEPGPEGSSGGCQSSGAPLGAGGALLALLAVGAARRRRRRQ